MTRLSLTLGLAMFFFLARPATADAAVVSGITPDVLSPGSTVLTITGSGFGLFNMEQDIICFNETNTAHTYTPCVGTPYGNQGNVVSWTDTTIVVNVPADPNGYMEAGYLSVYADGYLATSLPLYHMQPEITSIDRTEAGFGQAVIVTGKYFLDQFGSAVDYTFGITPKFNAVVGGGNYDAMTKRSLTTYVPHDATTGPVSIEFKYQPDGPILTAVGPILTILPPYTNDYYSAMQRYIGQVRANEAWALAGTGRAPIVAVIDEGVYINHPDLLYNIWINKKEKIGNDKDDDHNGYVDDIYGWDYIKGSGEMTVYGTHGTLVAGIIGAIKNNTEGISGIAPTVKIMPLRVCDSGGCDTTNIVKAIRYAVDKGATIINISLGSQGTTGYTTAYNKAIKYAYDHGVVIVAAAGNGDLESGRGEDLNIVPESPVCNDVSKNAVIGVAAVDSNDFLTSWSNIGSNCVDAYAPGVNIISTAVPQYSNVGGYYDDSESGTSFASPIVTGIVALLRQKFPYMPNSDVVNRIRAAYNAHGVIDAYVLLSSAIAHYKPPTISSISPAFTKTSSLSGARTITVTGKKFSKYTAVTVGYTKATIKYISATSLTATFPISALSYGNNLITITGGNKQRSIFRWYQITK